MINSFRIDFPAHVRKPHGRISPRPPKSFMEIMVESNEILMISNLIQEPAIPKPIFKSGWHALKINEILSNTNLESGIDLMYCLISFPVRGSKSTDHGNIA